MSDHTVYLIVIIIFVCVLGLVGFYLKRKKLRKCPKCSSWKTTEEISMLDEREALLPTTPGYKTFLYKFKCKNCSNEWEVTDLESDSPSD